MRCPECNSSEVQKRGTRGSRQRYNCKSCGKYFSGGFGSALRGFELFGSNVASDMPGAKILVYDIETSPIVVYTWGLKPHYISPKNVIHDRFIISWAAKWLGENEIMSDVLTPKEARAKSDKRIVSSFWKLLNEADIVIAHNGDRFDMKHLNAKFLEHDIIPPRPYRSIDTLKSTRRVFGFTSNALDYLTTKLSIGQKIETNFKLWIDCMEGIASSLKEMVTYNENDIIILEDWYMKIRRWIPNHPNIGMYSSDNAKEACPVCGGGITIDSKIATTTTNSWKTFRCNDCKRTGRTKINSMTKEEKRFFITR